MFEMLLVYDRMSRGASHRVVRAILPLSVLLAAVGGSVVSLYVNYLLITANCILLESGIYMCMKYPIVHVHIALMQLSGHRLCIFSIIQIVGYFGISQQDCENKSCCWSPADVSPVV